MAPRRPGHPGTIRISGAAPFSAGFLGIGASDANLTAAGAPFLLDPLTLIVLPLAYSAAGDLAFPADLSQPAFAGLSAFLQAGPIQSGALFTSNGLQLLLCR
jgi:hypothetical protein